MTNITTLLTSKLFTVSRSRSAQVTESVTMVCLVASVAAVFLTRGYDVSGSCMEPHILTKDRVVSSRWAYEFHHPHRGDVVIFEYPRDPRKIYVKRVIGMPGEVVSIRDGMVYINHKPISDPYRVYLAHGDMHSVRVPSDQYFVLGDNRDVSEDSRYWGTLPRQAIIGQALACYWPINRLHMIN